MSAAVNGRNTRRAGELECRRGRHGQRAGKCHVAAATAASVRQNHHGRAVIVERHIACRDTGVAAAAFNGLDVNAPARRRRSNKRGLSGARRTGAARDQIGRARLLGKYWRARGESEQQRKCDGAKRSIQPLLENALQISNHTRTLVRCNPMQQGLTRGADKRCPMSASPIDRRYQGLHKFLLQVGQFPRTRLSGGDWCRRGHGSTPLTNEPPSNARVNSFSAAIISFRVGNLF